MGHGLGTHRGEYHLMSVSLGFLLIFPQLVAWYGVYPDRLCMGEREVFLRLKGACWTSWACSATSRSRLAAAAGLIAQAPCFLCDCSVDFAVALGYGVHNL